ncbi:MAG: glycosyltransferase [Sphaerobacteraceae bacterium]|nr:MAG: glycosyltransferase [Sphaerobacteraceae bacterium]
MSGRVLFITGEFPPMHGGIGDYTSILADALEPHGWESLFMTSSAALDGANDPRIVSTVDNWDSSIVETARQTIEETQPDLIHIQYQTGAFQLRSAINTLPLRLGFRQRPVPVVTTYHDLLRPYLFPKAGIFRRWANRALAHGSDAIILTNERDYNQVHRNPRYRDRLWRIPIGSNLPVATDVDRDEVLARYDLDPAGFVIGFFGFLTADKGVDDLLDALERPDMTGIELLVISGDLPTTDTSNQRYFDRITARLRNASVPTTITGYIAPEEAAQALAAVDLIALPLRGGASLRSGTLLAALKSGTPVITTDPRAGDSLAPFSPGESIWLVPVSETDFLHEAIQLLRLEPSLRVRLSAAAVDASRQFSWDAIAERHLEVYTSVTQKSG